MASSGVDPASPSELAKSVVGFWNHMRTVSAEEFVERVGELGMTIKQIEILRALDEAGEMKVGALAARVLLAPNEVIRATDGPVASGLLERSGAPADSLTITEAGRSIVAELGDLRQQAAERYFDEMTEAQRSRLASALEILPRSS